MLYKKIFYTEVFTQNKYTDAKNSLNGIDSYLTRLIWCHVSLTQITGRILHGYLVILTALKSNHQNENNEDILNSFKLK